MLFPCKREDLLETGGFSKQAAVAQLFQDGAQAGTKEWPLVDNQDAHQRSRWSSIGPMGQVYDSDSHEFPPFSARITSCGGYSGSGSGTVSSTPKGESSSGKTV